MKRQLLFTGSVLALLLASVPFTAASQSNSIHSSTRIQSGSSMRVAFPDMTWTDCQSLASRRAAFNENEFRGRTEHCNRLSKGNVKSNSVSDNAARFGASIREAPDAIRRDPIIGGISPTSSPASETRNNLDRNSIRTNDNSGSGMNSLSPSSGRGSGSSSGVNSGSSGSVGSSGNGSR